jgi:hypothetical protein
MKGYDILDVLIKKTFFSSVLGKNDTTVNAENEERLLEISSIKKEVAKLNRDIQNAERGLELICDEDLIEAQIFEIRALKARYAHFIKKAKLLTESELIKR